MITKWIIIGILFADLAVGRDANAQSKQNTNGVINFVVDSVLLKNPGPLSLVSMVTQPYILASLTTQIRPGTNSYGFVIATLREYNRIQDTVALHRQTPIDLSTLLHAKKNLILSNLLPDDPDFNKRVEGIFTRIYLSTPFFFDKETRCMITTGTDAGGQLLLLTKKTGHWQMDKLIASWVY